MRPLNRIQPKMPASAYKTVSILARLSTHWREGTGAEADGRAYARGWVSPIDERTVEGQRHAHHIRKVSRRKYTEHRDPGGMTVFTFEAGQQCFTKHQVPLERPELFVVREGDFRGNPRGIGPVQHSRPENWVSDFQEHHDRIKTALERG